MSWDEIYTSKEMSELHNNKRRSERLSSLSSIQGISSTPGTSRSIRSDKILPQHIGIVRQGSPHIGERTDATRANVDEKEK